jgi:hypothetical protein
LITFDYNYNNQQLKCRRTITYNYTRSGLENDWTLRRSEEKRKQGKLMYFPIRLKLCEGLKPNYSTDRGSLKRLE